MNQRKAGALLSYIHIIVTNTISLFYTPYMLRLMGQSEYGLYGTAGALISYLSILNFGIGGAYIRFNAIARANGDREEERRLNGMFLAVFGCLALLVFICGMIFIVFAGKLVENTFTAEELLKLRIIMFILIINMMITFVCNVFMMALQAYEQFFFIRIVLLVMGIVQPVVNIIVLYMGGRAVAFTAAALVSSIISYSVMFLRARSAIHFEVTFKGFRRDLLKEIFVFSGFLFLNSVTNQITFSTDNVVLSSVKGTSAVAVYTVGSQFSNYFHQFSGTVSGVFAPRVNQLVAGKSDIRELDSIFLRIGRIQFYVVALILTGYISIGHSFIKLWAGPDYGDSFYIGLLLMLSVFVPAFQSVGLQIQQAMNMHKARSLVYFLIAICNVIITIPLAKAMSGIGAALATTICMFMGTVVFMNWYYKARIGLDIPGFWKSIAGILPAIVPPAAVGFAINRYWIIDSWLEILLSAAVITAVYAVSVWFLSMNSYEKEIFAGPFRKIRKKLIRR